jgi:hypothetical protein
MYRRTFLAGLLATVAIRPALAAREPQSFVIALPANRSPDTQQEAGRLATRLYTEVIPGDWVTFFDASQLKIVTSFQVPADLGESERERDEALGDLFLPINRFIAQNDAASPLNNLNIPETLRELGINILPKFPDRRANIVMIGSMIWDNPKTAVNWSFRNRIPSDAFLADHGSAFGLGGQETILSGALVSLLYTDRSGDFEWEGFRKLTIAFWGKSILGRGGRIGAIKPFDADSFARLTSSVEDTTPYPINLKDDRYLIKPGMIVVPERTAPPQAEARTPPNGSASPAHSEKRAPVRRSPRPDQTTGASAQ